MLIFAKFSRYIAKVRHLFIKGLCYRESFVFIRDNFFLRKWARWAFIGYENEYIQIFLMLSKCELKKKLHINMMSMCTWNMHACLFTFFLKSSILIDIWRNKTFRLESKTKKPKPRLYYLFVACMTQLQVYEWLLVYFTNIDIHVYTYLVPILQLIWLIF